MNCEKLEKTLKIFFSSGISSEEVLNKLQGLHKFRILPSFILLQKITPLPDEEKWYPRLFEELKFNEYSEVKCKLNFDYLNPKTNVLGRQKMIDFVVYFNLNYIIEVTQVRTNFYRLSDEQEKNLILSLDSFSLEESEKESLKLVWVRDIQPVEMIIQRSNSLQLWKGDKLILENQIQGKFQSHFDSENHNNLFFVYSDQQNRFFLCSKETSTLSDIKLSYLKSVGCFNTLIGLLVTREDIIVITDYAIYIYEKGIWKSELEHKQSINFKTDDKQKILVTAISDNLFDIECNRSHHLYSKIRDTWIPLQILSGHGKHDNVIRVPVSHNLLVKKAKTLPLNLPLDLTVEMIKFLI